MSNQATAQSFRNYLNRLDTTAKTGQTTEPSFYSALETLVNDLAGHNNLSVTAVTQPKHVSDAGAPDFAIVDTNGLPIGYIEAKDLGVSLDPVEHSEQLKRYRKALPNLILTNFLEFRWYINGQVRESVSLGTYDSLTRNIARGKGGTTEAAKLVQTFLATSPIAIGTSEELARRLAELARMLRDATGHAFPNSNGLKALRTGLQQTLLPDLPEADFSDLYAQTLTYGLFAARIGWQRQQGQVFNLAMASRYLRSINPFLENLFYHLAGPTLDPSIEWAANAIVGLLEKADFNAIMQDFANRSGREDPRGPLLRGFLEAVRPGGAGDKRRVLHSRSRGGLHRACRGLPAAPPLRPARRPSRPLDYHI